MRIARIGSLYQPVPALEYGGTQRSMAQMTAFQAAICAHDVTVYAPSDSTLIDFTRGIARKLGLATYPANEHPGIFIVNKDGRVGRVTLKSAGMPSIGYEDDPREGKKHDALFAEMLRDEKEHPFDIIHCHSRRYMAQNIGPAGLAPKTLVHQHNAVLEPGYKKDPYPLICISEGQAELMRRKYQAQVFDVVYHGLDSYTHQFSGEHAGYLAWIGRFLKDKGADRAIKIAEAAKTPLVMAGVVYPKKPESQAHFDADIKPRIDIHDPAFLTRTANLNPQQIRDEIDALKKITGKDAPVIFCGPADDAQKQALYGNAQATLFPISWPEPFGRVMIESMACGTPVVAYKSLGKVDCGSVGEIVADNVTGFALAPKNEQDGVRLAAAASQQAATLDRAQVRGTFDTQWTSERVARRLDEVYRRFLGEAPEPLAKARARTDKTLSL